MKPDDLLSGRSGREGIIWALNGEAPRRRLRNSLDELLTSPARLGPLRLTRAKYKPGRRLTAYYDVRLAIPGESGRTTRPIAVDWRPSGSSESSMLAQSDTLLAEAERLHLAFPFRRLEADLPDLNVHIQISPLDPGFPQLVRLSNPAYVKDCLISLQGSRESPASLSEAQVTITPIRYRPGERHVLRFDHLGSPEDGRSTFFAKLYAKPAEGPRRMRIAQRVAIWLEECGGTMVGTRPSGYLAEDQAVIFPLISGAPLSYHLRRPTPWVGEQLNLAGAGMRSLHDGPQSLADELELKTFDEEVRVITRASEHIHVLLPEVGAQIAEILELARSLHARLPQEPPTFTHSDFKADHLRATKNGLALFDFDTCSLSDPALDVGKFLADLQWWFMLYKQTGVEQAQEAVLSGYNINGLGDRLMRSRLYEALILVKITIRRVRLYDPNWAGLTRRLVDCAGQVIQRLAADLS